MIPDVCPSCGADVPRKARACPQCGADEETGWSEASETDGLALPSEDFDYNKFVEEEFGKKPRLRPHGIAWWWWVIAIGLVVLFVVGFVR